LASNDGYLLVNYLEKGIPVLGIDPAEGPVEEARKVGVNSLNEFFTLELAEELAVAGTRADVIHANNVLAHVADLNGFVEGIATLLKEDGVAVLEVPYLRELIERCEFDTIYHEHLCYFSVTALDKLFRRHALYLNDLRHLEIHGGSLRLYVEKQTRPSQEVITTLARESAVWVFDGDYYLRFAERVKALKTALRNRLEELRAGGASIAGYGAAAKGTTLINYIGLDKRLIEFVVDRSSHKQGLHMPGMHQPIFAPEALLEASPDYVLLMAWNFAEEILSQQSEYLRSGGRFILPLPEPQILGPCQND
jgi:hypothetical protein